MKNHTPTESVDIQARSLVDVLAARAQEHGERTAFRFLSWADAPLHELSFAELDRQARVIALHLVQLGRGGDRVLLLYPPGLDYIVAFMGCLYGDMVAVPLYPPRANQKLYRAGKVLLDCGAQIALTDRSSQAAIQAFLGADDAFAHISVLVTDDLVSGEHSLWRAPSLSMDTLAFLQYTSGSTGTPKGVMVSHGNIMANEHTIVNAIKSHENDVFVSWLPIYHDMGLIGAILQTIYRGFTTCLMSPTGFIRDPLWWLETISAHGGTISGGPNFGFELCCDRVTPERLAKLDLSSWRLAFNGAEPVRGETLRRFAKTFAPAGFRETAFYPCYGMAETTLFITGGQLTDAPPICGFDRDALAADKVLVQADTEKAMLIVGCGQTHVDDEVAIVNPTTLQRCAASEIGEIWVQSSGKALGYWQRPQLSQDTFQAFTQQGEGPFLRTGDLGFVNQGELFVSGRLKDLIILRGRNYYPQDLELSAQRSHPALQADACAAFSVAHNRTEQLVIVIEIKRSFVRRLNEREVFGAIRGAISQHHELAVGDIVLLPPGRVLKTSSGKIRRGDCRKAYASGSLAGLARSAAMEAPPLEVGLFDREALLNAEYPIMTLVEHLQQLIAARLNRDPKSLSSQLPMVSLGMDSMTMIGLQHGLERSLKIQVPIDVFLSDKSLEALAADCWTRIYENEAQTDKPMQLASEFLMAPNQKSLWNFYKLAPQSAAYNLPYAVRVLAALDQQALSTALGELFKRHRMLRASFQAQGEQVITRISTSQTPLSVLDASDWSDPRLQSHLLESARLPFDLSKGPLFRVELLRAGDEDHYLLFNMHHMIGDMWSLLILIEELSVLYSARGQKVVLERQTLDYADFAARGLDFAHSDLGKRQWAYWQNQLAGELPVLELPTDKARPTHQTHRGRSLSIELDSNLSNDLRQMAANGVTTPMTVLLAAFQLMLHRYSGQDDLTVGIPDSGRSQAGYRNLVGYFINPLVMRSQLNESLSWWDYLTQTERCRRDALSNAGLPFQVLLERLAPKRQAGRTPLFQVMFSLQEPHHLTGAGPFALRQPGARLCLGELEMESVALDPETTQFDLTLYTADTGRGFIAYLEYNSDLFQNQTAGHFIEYWRHLLTAVAAQPHIPLAQLVAIDEETRLCLLETWNQNRKVFEDRRSLPQRFLAAAAAAPDSLAVYTAEGCLSYGQLKEHAMGLAAVLQSRGIGPEKRVGVCCDRRLFLAEAAVAVFLCGATYVPLDPSHPTDRLAYILSDSEVATVLTTSEFRPLLPDDIHVLLEGETQANYKPEDPHCQMAAYIIYTSGSTGKPKGVCTPYGGLTNLIDGQIADFDFGSTDRTAVLATTGFDASVWEIWASLATGASLHFLPPGTVADPIFLANWLQQQRISFGFMTTRLGVALLEHLQNQPELCLSLRCLLIGGEKLHNFPRNLPFKIYNVYGPTENSVLSSACLLSADMPSSPPPIGKALTNISSLVLNPHGQLQPIGAMGQLYLGGSGLARGYVGRAAQTAEKFVPDPYAKQAGARLYATGDRVRFDHHGSIHFMGRIDFQVKLRGFRIEPEEVAHCLSELPSVADAVVILAEEGAARGHLVAYIVPEGGDYCTQSIKIALAEKLPAFMIPTAFVALPAWPLTPNGKINRAAFPPATREHLVSDDQVKAPRNEVEAKLCAIWSEVLGLDQLGIDDNFFESGGDSILAIQIQTRCAKAGLAVSPAQLFRFQTIALLASQIGEATSTNTGSEAVDGLVTPGPIQTWFFRQNLAEPQHFNQSVLLEVDATLSETRLQAALDQLHRHHHGLRLRLCDQGLQYAAQASIVLESVSLPDNEEAAVLELTTALQTSLDLHKGPLAAAGLFVTKGASPNLLFITIHHLVVDGVSWRILLEDLTALLKGEELPKQTSSFGHWSRRLPEVKVDVAYWQKLSRANSSMQTDGIAPDNSRARDTHLELCLDAGLTEDLLRKPVKIFATGPHEVLLTALARSLTRKNGGGHLLVDLESHGRTQLFDDLDLSRTSGWFTCMYPVGLNVSCSGDPGDDLLAVKEQLRQVPNNGIDFALVQNLSQHRQLAQGLDDLQAQVLFNYLGRFDQSLKAPLLGVSNWQTGPDRSPAGARTHVLEVDAMVIDGKLRINFGYDAATFKSSTLQALAEAMEKELKALVASCEGSAKRYATADFPYVSLTKAALTDLLKKCPGLTDIFPLGPTQEGMFFHALYHDHSPAYFEQLHLNIDGHFNLEAMQQAWQGSIRHNPALAAGFHWEHQQPLQVIDGEATPAWHVEDLSKSDSADQSAVLSAFLDADRKRGFNLTQAPLMRFALFKLGPQAWSFVWSYHHLLLDGWSLSLVLEEVFDAYQALKNKREPVWRERPLLRDFIQTTMQRDEQRAHAFWKQELSGFSAPLVLPMDKGTASNLMGHEELQLSSQSFARLEHMARNRGLTLSTCIQAAWSWLLARYCRSSDIVYGLTVSGRENGSADLANTVGLLINTIPVRHQIDPQMALHTCLQQMQTKALERSPFSSTALTRIRDLSPLPVSESLFDTLLVVENYPLDSARLEQKLGLKISEAHTAAYTHFGLTLVARVTHGLGFQVAYDAARYQRGAMVRLLSHMETILSALPDHLDKPIHQLPLLTQDERRQLLHDWNQTSPADVQTGGIHELFVARAQKTPQAEALTLREGQQRLSVTYGQLLTAAGALANRLKQRGVGAESLVGLHMERSPELVVGILGILMAGGAYVPLDPVYPIERLNFMATDAKLQLVIHGEHNSDFLELCSLERVLLDPSIFSENSEDAPTSAVLSQQTAYIIYTSGSTGKPKGVPVPHGNILRLFSATSHWFDFHAGDVWTLFHSYAFDFTVWELWGALIHGGRLVIVPQMTARSPEVFHDLLIQEKVTVLNQTPSAFVRLIAADEAARHSPQDLRYVIFGGEALEPRTLMPWFQRHGHQEPELVNMYGITETTVHVTYRRITPADMQSSGSNVGVRIPDLKLHLLDSYGEIVPLGVSGEIYVGGQGPARGYLGQPALTATRFLPDPYAKEPGSRLYRSGDLGRFDELGALEYTGRCDFQVKIRGYRIELGEVEAALTDLEGIRHAIVLAREDLPDLHGKQLVAYLVSEDSSSHDPEQLHRALGQSLPDYMVPAHYVFLKTLPLTAHGKVDRRQLPLPGLSTGVAKAGYKAPRNRVETALAEIWQEVLQVPKVGISDRFFELGGDSILSIRIMSQARSKGLELSLAQLFEFQTIEKLAPLMGHSQSESIDSEPFSQLAPEERAAVPDGVADAYPATKLQTGMLFHGEREKDAYHNLTSIRLRCSFDGTRLHNTVALLIQRHPVLRTAFDLEHFSEPMQLVYQALPTPLQQHDLRPLGEGAHSAFQSWFEAEKRAIFQWHKPGLLRFNAHRLSDEVFVLTLTEHHAILDGWSVASLLSELFMLYLGKPVKAAPSVSFARFVALEKQAIKQDGRYWADLLDGIEVNRIPRMEGADSGAAHLEVAIEGKLSQAIVALAASFEVPLKTILLALHLRVMNLWSASDDVVTGLVSNGRPEEDDGERTLGLFLNTLPLRCRFANESWRELVTKVFKSEREALPHRRFPLADMQKMFGGKELFETAFNYTHFHISGQINQLDGLTLDELRFHAPTPIPFAANFSRDIDSKGIRLSLDYRVDIFPHHQVRAIADHYLAAMEHLAQNPETAYRPIHFLNGEQREQVLLTWNQTKTRQPQTRGLHDLVIRQAQRTPDSVAVVALNPEGRGRELTYDRLISDAGRLAHYLIQRGAGPERPVAVCLERGPDAIVAILAILMTGSPYLPLDPAYPDDRLSYMLSDSAAVLVIGAARLASICDTVDLEACAHQIALCPDVPPHLRVDPQNAAYIIYTSGSTGKPKGVIISHRAILNQIFWRQAVFNLDKGDRLLQNLSLSFDPSVWQIFWPLSLGAQLWLMPSDKSRDIPWMASSIKQHQLNATAMVPSVLRLLLEEADFCSSGHLKHISCGGEGLPADLASRFCELFGEDGILHVVYGPTEATIDASTWKAQREVPTAIAPIGYPIHNARLYVLDTYLEPVPVGVLGELFIAGTGLGRGYLNRPGLSADRYLPNPFEGGGQRLYRTGDVVRMLAGGLIEFRGRSDHQVKLRGFRIELGEVEAVLNRHEDIAEVACLVREDKPGDRRLVAYLRGPARAEDLRSWLAARVPDYMVPATFVVLKDFPRLPNDKINRHLLPAPEEADRRSEAVYVAPTNERERQLTKIWQDVLGLNRVGTRDNFFELGGDSILCIQVVARARALGLQVSPQDIFKHQTVAELAAVPACSPTVSIDQGPVTGSVPLTPIQRWFFEHLDTAHFNQAVLLKIPVDLQKDRLQTALNQLTDHHDGLRLFFTRNEQGNIQQTYAQPGLTVPLSESTVNATRENGSDTITAKAGEVHQAFSLKEAPLLRAHIFHLRTPGEQAARLLLVAHHLVVDGVSWRFLVEDLQSLYQLDNKLPLKTSSFKDQAERLVADAFSEARLAEASFWLQQAPVQAPAFDGKHLVHKIGQSVSMSLELSQEQTHDVLRALPPVYKTRTDEILLTALARAWKSWSKGLDLVVDLESHGRENLFADVDHSRTCGWFTAAYPVHISLEDDKGVHAHIKAVKETLRRIPAGGLGYGILRYLNPQIGAQLAQRPKPVISFNYLGRIDSHSPEGLFSLASESSGPAFDPELNRLYAIEINGFVKGERLHLEWTYSPQQITPFSMGSLVAGFKKELETLIDHCKSAEAGGRTPSDFPLAALDQDALDSLVGNGRDVANLYPLSPMQKGMLFHTMSQPEKGLYHQQLWFTLSGELNQDAFIAAWKEVIQRHDLLRTGFVFEGLDEPLQRVQQHVETPWLIDPRVRSDREVKTYLAEDRRSGFNTNTAPLMRFALLGAEQNRCHFIWSHHHMLLDGWSLPIVLSELLACYVANLKGERAALAPAVSYGNYIQWLMQQDLAQARSWWQCYLANFAAPTALPAHSSESGNHATASLVLEQELTRAITDLSQSHQITQSTLFCGLWSLVLGCFSGDSDVVFGQTVSGRSAQVAGIDRAVGLFINTLPVRVDLTQDKNMLAWLHGLQADSAQRESYAWCGLNDIRSWSDVKGGRSLFDSVVVFENYPMDSALQQQDASLQWSLKSMDEQADLPLLLTVIPADALTLQLAYDGGLFTSALIDRLLAYLRNGLIALTLHPQQDLSRFSLLDERERKRLLCDFNDTAEYVNYQPLHHFFEQQVASNGSRIALTGADEAALTYAQLDALANGLAWRMREMGVGPETVVGICLERNFLLVISVLAVTKAGGAYLPIDTVLPDKRIAIMLEDAQPKLLITQSEQTQRFGDTPRLNPEGIEPRSQGPSVALDPYSALFYIYTSGSTGLPKACISLHKGVAQFCHWSQQTHRLQETDRLLLASAFNFDIFSWELWWPLGNGAILSLLPSLGLRDLFYLRTFIDQQQITVMHLVPSILNAFLEHLGNEIYTSSLRMIFTGGESLTSQTQRRVLAQMRSTSERLMLRQLYGPSEASVFSTSFACGDVPLYGVLPIGEPYSNIRCHVVDQNLRLLPVGAPGELMLAGQHLSRGYHRRVGLTAQKFIADPFSLEPGERLYRTGDMVRRRDDGALIFLGRIDHQVKLRGMRIELSEIESCLGTHPQVKEALVLVNKPSGREAMLVAYVRANLTQQLLTQELGPFLKDQLPAHMVPEAMILIENWPKLPSGKVNRQLLPEPSGNEDPEATVEPRNAAEQKLHGIWCGVFGREQVSIWANFFELGGHSLLATRVISQIKHQLGVEVPFKHFFAEPTIAAQALYIHKSVPGKVLPKMMAVARSQAPPLSYAQQRLWFLDRLEGDRSTATYNLVVALVLEGELHKHALQKALTRLGQRHETLRTHFHEQEGQAVQVIDAQPALILDERMPQQPQRTQIIKDEAVRGFDLAYDPLLRLVLVPETANQYLLILTMHHIISDGWSMGILVEELAAFYEAERLQQPVCLPELALQYADFSQWQQQEEVKQHLQTQAQWWAQQLRELPLLHQLATDRPRPAVLGHRGNRVKLELSQPLHLALNKAADEQGATLFMILLAAFKSLLAVYSGHHDIVVGTPIANRNHAEIEPLIGFFVNTLTMRNEVAPNQSFRHLLERVKNNALEAYAHQDVPFERVVEVCQPERSLSYSPLFQILFTLQNTPSRRLQLPELTMTTLPVETGTAKFDISLTAMEGEQGLSLEWEYNSELFDEDSAFRMLKHYGNLLAVLPQHMDSPIAKLPLFCKAERQELLQLCNQRLAEPVSATSIQELFEAQVRRNPQAPALYFQGQETSYGQLNERANRLAHKLIGMGIGPDDCVGIAGVRSRQTVVGLLAILKASAAYVPIDPALPQERLALMIAESGLSVILSPGFAADQLNTLKRPVLNLDRCDDWPSDGENPPLHDLSEHLAYIIYTSGSTGKPKGVAVPHKGVIRLVEKPHYCRVAQAESVLQFVPLSFDVSSFELWMPLAHGGRLCIYPEGHLDLSDLGDFLVNQHIAVAWLTTGLFNQMVDLNLDVFKGMRQVLAGGDQLSLAHVQRFLEAHPQITLTNGYGPTENTTLSSSHPMEGGDMRGVLIGQPLDHSTAYVLHQNMDVLPLGVAGELFLGGMGLARCYVQAAALTAERFVPNPFATRPGDRLYRSGDLVRAFADGNLAFLGRRDGQVKIRGYRIEIGEIEYVLAQHPGVEMAAVVVKEEPSGAKALAALLQWHPHSQAHPDLDGIQTYLRQHLPGFMVPSAFISVPQLPLTSNGKLDRKALNRLDTGHSSDLEKTVYVAPNSMMETSLVAIWQELLGKPQIGIRHQFFQLGGHSLLATSLVARIRDSLQLELPVRAVFEHPTIESMAHYLERQAPLAVCDQELVLDPPGTLSASQARLWGFFKAGASSVYNVTLALRIRGQLSLEALSAALTRMIERHESLRTTFGQKDGEAPFQVVHPAAPAQLHVIELGDERAALGLMREEAQHVFDLEKGPLLRIWVVRLDKQHHILHINKHHIITDGWSMSVFARETSAWYHALAHDPKAIDPLPPMLMQFPEYARRERAYLTGSLLKAKQDWWRTRLRGLPILKLPTDFAPAAVASHRAGVLPIEMSPTLTDALTQFSHSQNASVFMVLAAAFTLMLSRFSGQNDFAVGTPIAARDRAEWEGLIGFMVGGLLLRVQRKGPVNFREWVAHLRQVSLDAYAHQDLPFTKVAETFFKDRGNNDHPLLQVMVSQQNLPSATLRLPGLDVAPLDLDVPVAKYDLTVVFGQQEGGLRGQFIYRENLFREETAKRMLDDLMGLLEQGLANPEQALDKPIKQ